MLKDIKRMITELINKTSAEHIEITGLSFRYKHTAFSAPSYTPLMRLIYTAEPPSYEAKNLKNAVNYKNDWKIYIHILPSMNNKSLINLTATYLKEKAQKFWMNNYVLIKTWDEYIKWCQGLIVNPVNYIQYALIQLKSVKQWLNQSIHNLVAIIKNLKKNISEMSE